MVLPLLLLTGAGSAFVFTLGADSVRRESCAELSVANPNPVEYAENDTESTWTTIIQGQDETKGFGSRFLPCDELENHFRRCFAAMQYSHINPQQHFRQLLESVNIRV